MNLSKLIDGRVFFRKPGVKGSTLYQVWKHKKIIFDNVSNKRSVNSNQVNPDLIRFNRLNG